MKRHAMTQEEELAILLSQKNHSDQQIERINELREELNLERDIEKATTQNKKIYLDLQDLRQHRRDLETQVKILQEEKKIKELQKLLGALREENKKEDREETAKKIFCEEHQRYETEEEYYSSAK